MGCEIALSAALGPTPETVMNRSKNSRSTSFVNPTRMGVAREGSTWW